MLSINSTSPDHRWVLYPRRLDHRLTIMIILHSSSALAVAPIYFECRPTSATISHAYLYYPKPPLPHPSLAYIPLSHRSPSSHLLQQLAPIKRSQPIIRSVYHSRSKDLPMVKCLALRVHEPHPETSQFPPSYPPLNLRIPAPDGDRRDRPGGEKPERYAGVST
jgi:hypothetical protein